MSSEAKLHTHFADEATLAYIAKLEAQVAEMKANNDRYQFITSCGALLGLSLQGYYEIDGPITDADIDTAMKCLADFQANRRTRKEAARE